MVKRLMALCLALAMLGALTPVLADGIEYPVVFQEVNGLMQMNMDCVYDALQNEKDYQETLTFGASKFAVTGTLPQETRDEPVWLEVWRVDTEELVYSALVERVADRFVSDVIETPYTGMKITQYRVELTAGDYYRSVVINRELIYLQNNTVSAMGIRFRDLEKEFAAQPITDKWYMFTPVDLLSLNPYGGTITLPLFASNMYVVGSLVVTRQNDFIYVQAYPDMDVYMRNCYALFFENLDAVDGGLLSNSSMRRSGFEMGEAIGIYSHLGGNGMQLLYFSAMIDFDPNTKERLETVYERSALLEMEQVLRQIENGADGGVG